MKLSRLLSFFSSNPEIRNFRSDLKNVLGFTPGNLSLYRAALSHRSVREGSDENNERLEFLGDAVLSSIVGHYLFRKYPYKGEGFLTEMRSKMVNRQKLNEIALKMGLKKLTQFNRQDQGLKISQIFGNTLEALVGAVYLDKGYKSTSQWVEKRILLPFMFLDELETVDINIKNRIYGWANKTGKTVAFSAIDEELVNGRRLFTVAVLIDGEQVAEAKGYNKKDASHTAALQAVEKLGL